MSELTEPEREAEDLTRTILRYYGYTDDDMDYAEAIHPGRVCDEDCWDEDGKSVHPEVYDELGVTAALVVEIIQPWLAARAAGRGALAGEVRALADEWERRAAEVARDYGQVAQWAAYLSRCAELRALLAAEPAPDRPPLRDRVEAVLRAGMNGNLADALVEAIESGELAP